MARILANRSIASGDVAKFLTPRIRDWLPDPSHLLDLDQAVERMAGAIRNRETIGIIGDYDVDGATSTALLCRYLRSFECPFKVIIPDRLRDGYGPNKRAIDELLKAGASLLITLDSGTTAYEALNYAKAQGLDTIVIDHHIAELAPPPVHSLINPNRQDQQTALGHLAAVGVTFVCLVGLNRVLRCDGNVPDLMGWLDLVALGTVCDVVPLQGLNRAMVSQGLKVAVANNTPGLSALTNLAGISSSMDAHKFGFALGPRINAGGRLGRSELGWKLLACDDLEEARSIAETLDDMNRKRQQLERECLKAAEQSVRSQIEADRPVLVAAGQNWHVGVVGIAAARMVDKHQRPAFVIGFDGDTGKGSARSIAGIDIGQLVIGAKNEGLLAGGGGHPMAAGIVIERQKLEAFTEFVQSAVEVVQTKVQPAISIDALISPDGINLDLIKKLDALAPFGAGNPEPLIALPSARILRPREVGTGHLSCVIGGAAGGSIKAIAFRAAQKGLDHQLSQQGGTFMLAGKLRRDDYGGTPKPSFEIEDAARSRDH